MVCYKMLQDDTALRNTGYPFRIWQQLFSKHRKPLRIQNKKNRRGPVSKTEYLKKNTTQVNSQKDAGS